jgi:tRNA nucleotidyltransferase (CCA-adding enzyme)
MKPEEETMVWFQALLLGPAEKKARALSKRLMLSRSEQKIVLQSARVYPSLLRKLSLKNFPMSRLHRLLHALRPEVQCFLLAASPAPLRERLEAYLRKVRASEPWVRGRDLQALGLKPGRQYSLILLETLDAQLDGKLRNRRAALGWVKEKFAQ